MVVREVAPIAAHLEVDLALLMFRFGHMALQSLHALSFLFDREWGLQFREGRILDYDTVHHVGAMHSAGADRRRERFAFQDRAHARHLRRLHA
jgi:hypothetical protein